MRDEDEETRPLRFGASRGDRKPLGQQIRDDEDAYWCTAQDLENHMREVALEGTEE